MNDKAIPLLLVEDNPGDERLIREMLREAETPPFHVESVDRLSVALTRLDAAGIEIILSDLSLPDSFGLETFEKIHARAPNVPVIVLTGSGDEALAIQAVSKGAQDYLVKGQVDGNLMVRAIRYAIERHGLVVQLEREQEERRRTERLAAIAQLVAGAAGALNIPLDTISSEAQLLTKGDLPPWVKRYGRQIIRHARDAGTIVHNLLAYTRQQELRTAAVNLNSVLRRMVESQIYENPYDEKRTIQVDMSLASKLPEVQGDLSQLECVFVNLIENARTAMVGAHGRGKLRIVTEEVGDTVRVTIADDGPGIPQEDHRKIFDPFFTTKAATQGVGLGLSVCEGIVIQHGGRIWVESEYGNGAAFYVEFPCASGPPGEENRPELEHSLR